MEIGGGGTERKHGYGPGQQEAHSGYVIPEVTTLAIRGRGEDCHLETRQDGTANAVLTPNGGRAGIGVGAVAFDWQSGGDSRGLDPKETAQLQRCQVPATQINISVRRLTPIECARLQGFPDLHCMIPRSKWRNVRADEAAYYRRHGLGEWLRDGKTCIAADGPQYKAYGNSMAVNCMRWLGRRIEMVES